MRTIHFFKAAFVVLALLKGVVAYGQFHDNLTTGIFKTFIEQIVLEFDSTRYKTIAFECRRLMWNSDTSIVLIFCSLNSDSIVECVEIENHRNNYAELWKSRVRRVGAQLLRVDFLSDSGSDSTSHTVDNGIETFSRYATGLEGKSIRKIALYPGFNRAENKWTNHKRKDTDTYVDTIYMNGNSDSYYWRYDLISNKKSKISYGCRYGEIHSKLDTIVKDNGSKIISETTTILRIDSTHRKPEREEKSISDSYEAEYFPNGLVKSMGTADTKSSMTINYLEERERDFYKYLILLQNK